MLLHTWQPTALQYVYDDSKFLRNNEGWILVLYEFIHRELSLSGIASSKKDIQWSKDLDNTTINQ